MNSTEKVTLVESSKIRKNKLKGLANGTNKKLCIEIKS